MLCLKSPTSSPALKSYKDNQLPVHNSVTPIKLMHQRTRCTSHANVNCNKWEVYHICRLEHKNSITLTTNRYYWLLGAHLISCCLNQISVVHLTEWTSLINSRSNQLWMQSDPWGDYWLLSSDLQWSQLPVPHPPPPPAVSARPQQSVNLLTWRQLALHLYLHYI